MPELIKSRLLSLCGTREKLFIARCPLLSKNSRNILLNSFTPYAFTFLPPSLFLTTFFHRPRNTEPLYPDRYGSQLQFRYC